MSSLSNFAKEVIVKVLDIGKVNGRHKNNTIDYSITLSDKRDSPIAMTSSFKFKKPVSAAELEGDIPAFVQILSDHLVAENLGVINAVMRKAGLKSERMGTSKATGSLAVSTGEIVGEVGAGLDSLTSVRSKSGRFISISNFKALLEVAVRSYMMKHMTSSGPQLHNRTGRFINSTEMVRIGVRRSGFSSKNVLSIHYGYMENPYGTFDPAGPNSRGLASAARNPRRIIGDAIAKAVDDLVNMQSYELEVTQR